MKSKAALLAATCIAAVSCSNSFETQDATLLMHVNSREQRLHWPPDDSGEEVTLVNALDDPRGFAGFELEIGSVDPRMTFTAADFVDGGLEFRVPDSGAMRFSARLVQDNRVVAEGSGMWTLEPNVEWRLRVNRAPFPPDQPFGFTLDDIKKRSPPCGWWWCWRNWRFPITDDAANYEYEALWLSLHRVHPDECVDVC